MSRGDSGPMAEAGRLAGAEGRGWKGWRDSWEWPAGRDRETEGVCVGDMRLSISDCTECQSNQLHRRPCWYQILVL